MKKQLVIIGGGFAGSYVAKKLEDTFKVTLIDSKDYFEFTPSVLRVIVYPELMGKIQTKYKNFLKNSRFILGEVKEVGNKSVLVNNERIQFDYLVVSSGSKYGSPIKQGNIVMDFRAKMLRDYHKELEKAKTVLIVGGGLVGTELASEIAEKYPSKKLTLITASEKLIPRNNHVSSDVAEWHLKEKKVVLRFNEEVIMKNGFVFTPSKNLLKADIVFYCNGIKCNSEFMTKYFSDKIEGGFLKVNESLQLQGMKNIFVAGDLVNIKEEKTAQNSEKHAKVVIKNLINLEKEKPLVNYVSKKRPFVISLGETKGIFEINNFSWYGRIPAMMKKIVQWKTMRRYR